MNEHKHEQSVEPTSTAKSQSKMDGPANRRGSLVRVICESTALIDAFAIISAAVVAEIAYRGLFIDAGIDFGRATGIGLLAAVTCVVIFAHFRLYGSANVIRPKARSYQMIILGWLLVCFCLVVAAFLTKTSSEFSRGWAILWAICTPPAIISGRAALRRIASALVGPAGFARHVAIVGRGPIADKLALRLQNMGPEFVLVGVFDDRTSVRACTEEPQTAPNGTTADLLEFGRTERLDEVILTLPMNARPRIKAIVELLAVLPIEIRVCAGLPIIEGTPPHFGYLDDIPVITVLNSPIGEWSWLIKAVFDRTAAALGLIVLSPLLLSIALLVKLDSKGPALFRQKRHGYNHQIIQVLKFRSMTVMESGIDIRQATKNDVRTTRFGAVLRRTSLDELPQLVNVLRGEMSLVGPRPHALSHNEYYEKIIGQYANRHRVKPGITGLAQVNGLRGETETLKKMADRVEYDLYYIENWSIWLDLAIIFRTILALPFKRNAY